MWLPGTSLQIRNGPDPAYNRPVTPPSDDDRATPADTRFGNGAGRDVGPDSRRKLRFLASPSSYPETTAAVRVVETHFAWVFLTDTHAWKMKKPIRAQMIDYRRLEDRRHYCHEELRLNRRLADWVYLDVVPLTEAGDGALGLGGRGRAIDWLVKMVRLPAGDMLDRRIRGGRVTDTDLARIARHVAGFHAGLDPEPLEPQAYVARLLAEADKQELDLTEIDDAITSEPWRAAIDDQRRYLREHAGRVGARAAAGRIVETHGDLRPEHVFLGRRFAVIDCLEFSRDLRIQDGAEETAFLALECQIEAGAELRDRLLAAWRAASGDAADDSLMAFYLSRRAIVRAILSAWHLDDPAFDRARYIGQARRYIELARGFIAEAFAVPRR